MLSAVRDLGVCMLSMDGCQVFGRFLTPLLRYHGPHDVILSTSTAMTRLYDTADGFGANCEVNSDISLRTRQELSDASRLFCHDSLMTGLAFLSCFCLLFVFSSLCLVTHMVKYHVMVFVVYSLCIRSCWISDRILYLRRLCYFSCPIMSLLIFRP